MKKLAIFAVAVSAMMLAACGGQTNQAASENDSDSVAVISFDQSQIEQKIMVELDSVATEWSKLNPVEGVYANGKIKLSDDELKVKPDYLLDPASVADLTTATQKYRALGMLTVDLNIAQLYQMDEAAIKGAVAKISADVSDPSFKEIGGGTADKVKAFYDAEKANGHLNLFWEASAGAIIENLYVISKNADKLILAFDDQSASDFTLHIVMLKDAIDELGAYDEDIKALSELLAPVNEINAMNVAQLKEQITKIQPQIEASRAAFLK